MNHIGEVERVLFIGEATVDNTTIILVVIFAVLVIAYSARRRSRLRSED